VIPRFIYGAEGEFDGKKLFAQSNLDWDGHAWVVCGDWLGDVSILRTARSGRSHPKLKAHLEEKFGSRTGLFAGKIATIAEDGLRYEPRYVLTLDQVNALTRGADLFIQRD
jgi:hypothetical protein